MRKKILIVVADYYKNISKGLLDSTKKHLKNSFYTKEIFVPGVFEITIVIAKNIKKYEAFIALGCVIKGETPHFDFISKATTQSLMDISVNFKKPVGNGVITCLNKKQALARLKKGAEAAYAVEKLLSL